MRHTNSCYFTMVAVGPDGRAVPVPPWEPRTPEEHRRHAAAGRRRELRRDIERMTKEIKSSGAAADDGSRLSLPVARTPPGSERNHAVRSPVADPAGRAYTTPWQLLSARRRKPGMATIRKPGDRPVPVVDPFPTKNLPRRRCGSCRSRRRTWRMIGPGIIAAGVGLASGEFILFPYIASQVGLVFVWAAMVGLVTQYFLNMEIERYTLATGETALTGFSRYWRHWGLVFAVLTYFANLWPGWATSSATLVTYLFGGDAEVDRHRHADRDRVDPDPGAGGLRGAGAGADAQGGRGAGAGRRGRDLRHRRRRRGRTCRRS